VSEAAAIAKQEEAPRGIAGLVRLPNVRGRIEEVLGERAPQFAASLVSLVSASPALQACSPQTVLAAAMTAALLDLPINKDLGFAWIVPYKGQAQFQMGYKGFIQLGLRTGQYSRMNAVAVNAEAFGGYDEVGEPVILWDKLDRTKPAVGYAFAFKLTNGFVKVSYWTQGEVQAHATRYSQAFKSGKKDTPWTSHPDEMALKTVVKNTLSKWGILSIELRRAVVADQAVLNDVDAAPQYLDAPAMVALPTPEDELTDKYAKGKKADPPAEPLPGACSLCGHAYKETHFTAEGAPKECSADGCTCLLAIEQASA
jgi:recombination protein RecT